jgi:hypothetical protein
MVKIIILLLVSALGAAITWITPVGLESKAILQQIDEGERVAI